MTLLNEEESLACIAEEASELAQAALKLRRALFCSKTNPTPVSVEEARKKIIEEFADVVVAYSMYDDIHHPDETIFNDEVLEMMSEKVNRTAIRLEGADNDGDECCDGDSCGNGTCHCGNDYCDL